MPAKKSKEEMDEIKQSLSNILQEIGKIASQQTQILKLFEQVDGLQKQLVTLKNENQEKNREIVNLKVRMDELEQYSRIDDVIITGLKTRHRSYEKRHSLGCTRRGFPAGRAGDPGRSIPQWQGPAYSTPTHRWLSRFPPQTNQRAAASGDHNTICE